MPHRVYHLVAMERDLGRIHYHFQFRTLRVY